MSYITSNLAPYRSKNIGKEFSEILAEDYEWVRSSIEDRGIIFFLATISVMTLSLFKAISHVITQMQKPVMEYNHLKLHRGMESESITQILTRRECIDEVKNHDNLCPNNKVKTEKVEKLNTLRNYLYQHDLTLHATVLKTINHKLTDDELIEMYRLGEITKPLTTTHITFGDNLNRLLKDTLGNTIDLKTNRVTKETYLRIFNDDYMPIKEGLQNLYNEKVKLKFD